MQEFLKLTSVASLTERSDGICKFSDEWTVAVHNKYTPVVAAYPGPFCRRRALWEGPEANHCGYMWLLSHPKHVQISR